MEGYVVASKEPGRYDNRAVLAVKLENFRNGEERNPIQANVVTRIAEPAAAVAVANGPERATVPRVTLAAGSIVGFTLVGSLSN